MDWKMYVGTALLWYGVGVLTVAVAWKIETERARRKFEKIVHTVLDRMGHVVNVCDHGETIHQQCICGEASLMYKKDDPTADRLMAQWEHEHINSQMESADV